MVSDHRSAVKSNQVQRRLGVSYLQRRRIGGSAHDLVRTTKQKEATAVRLGTTGSRCMMMIPFLGIPLRHSRTWNLFSASGRRWLGGRRAALCIFCCRTVKEGPWNRERKVRPSFNKHLPNFLYLASIDHLKSLCRHIQSGWNSDVRAY